MGRQGSIDDLCKVSDDWFFLHTNIRADLRGRRGRVPSLFFAVTFSAITLINYVLFEVKLIIKNTPLTYIYPNTIETPLTSNHLLFCRQLLYSANIKTNFNYKTNRSFKHY